MKNISKTIKYTELSELQKETLTEIKKFVRAAHSIDLGVRCDGKNKLFQADFLREILLQII